MLVGLCVERRSEMVVGLLGILKAGGAYVPLDPDYPAERLGVMLDDARPAVVLTQEHLPGRLPRPARRRPPPGSATGTGLAGYDETNRRDGVRPTTWRT